MARLAAAALLLAPTALAMFSEKVNPSTSHDSAAYRRLLQLDEGAKVRPAVSRA